MKWEDWMLLALGMLVLTRKRVDWGTGWIWPVAPIQVAGRVYRPFISDGFTSRRGDQLHAGVDIVYPRRSRTDLVAEYPPGTPDGGRDWFAPRRSPIVAARAGRIWSVQKTERGWAVVIDHSQPFATFYQHLESSALPLHAAGVNTVTGQPTHVQAGALLGMMGFSPIDPERVRHLHFAVWHGGTSDNSVDPSEAMQSWGYAPTYQP